jgi:hypothetical protein
VKLLKFFLPEASPDLSQSSSFDVRTSIVFYFLSAYA